MRKILSCAARGVRDVGIKVVVRQGRWPEVRLGYESLVITCREPGENPFFYRYTLSVGVWVARRFPGLLAETLQDEIVWLAAQGFYRIKHRRFGMFHLSRNAGPGQRFAFRRLNDWRVATGRQSVPETRGADNGGLVPYNRERQRQAQRRALTRRVAASPYPIGRFAMLGDAP